MERGGPSWAGWSFAPWGRAKEWRLHAPDGASYSAEEIAELRRLVLDLDYLQVRCRELEAVARRAPCRFSAAELELLASAAAVLQAALPRAAHQVRRWRPAPLAGDGDKRSIKRKRGDAEVPGRVEIARPRSSGAAVFARGRPVPP